MRTKYVQNNKYINPIPKVTENLIKYVRINLLYGSVNIMLCFANENIYQIYVPKI